MTRHNTPYPFKPYAVAAMLLGITAISNAWASESTYTDAHSFLVQAISTGKASGVLTGPIDEHFSRQFQSTGTLRIKARVIRELASPQCKHLEVVYTKVDVPTPKGKTEAILATELDYCLNGEPPMVQGAQR